MEKFFKVSDRLLIRVNSITSISKSAPGEYYINTTKNSYFFSVPDELANEYSVESIAKAIEGARHADSLCSDYETGLKCYKSLFND